MEVRSPEPPVHRGTDLVVLMPRDPDWGVAFWELSGRGMSTLTEGLRDWHARPILRLYTFPTLTAPMRSQRHVAEYVLDSWVGHRLVLLGPPGSLHQAVVGIGLPDGTFRPLCRSARSRSPRTHALGATKT